MKSEKVFFALLVLLMSVSSCSSTGSTSSFISENNISSSASSSLYESEPSSSQSSSFHNESTSSSSAGNYESSGSSEVIASEESIESILSSSEHNYVYHTDEKYKYYECSICGDIPWKEELYSTVYDYNINCLEYSPLDIEFREDKVPLVLYLHGASGLGNDNKAQVQACLPVIFKNEDKNFINSVILAPQIKTNEVWVTNDYHYPSGNYYANYTPETDVIKETLKIVKDYMDKPYIDTSRVYVFGISLGGFGTWDLLARHNDIFAAGCPIAGGGPIDMLETLNNVPVYTFHGDCDAVIGYYENTYELVNQLREEYDGEKLLFKTYYGEGHQIWDNVVKFTGDDEFPGFSSWLFSQHK